MTPKEEKKLREELKERKKWEKINDWTRLVGTSILFIIVLVALISRLLT